MSFGLRAYNESGQALLSEDTAPLNLWHRKTTPVSAIAGVTKNDSNVTSGTVSTYTSNAPAPPVVFVRVTSTYTCVLRIYGSVGNWSIEVLHTGPAPELFIFCKPVTAYSGPETYGMKVINASGETIFDSRWSNRLNVKQAITTPFTTLAGVPLPLYRAAGSQTTSYPSYDVYSARYSLNIDAPSAPQPTAITSPIVCLNSYAISEREFEWTIRKVRYVFEVRFNYSPSPQYYLDSDITYYRTEWCVYRGGVKFSGGALVFGWVPHAVGTTVESRNNSPVRWVDVGDGGFYYQPGAGTPVSTIPYANQSHNLPTGLIYIADAADYA